mmetsp:Transcript_27558/g.63883  ORF Transcript_27558/g.63883 Transcript_27558/m.63883 type:complete len:180 (-) Transcript_27558:8-547(-)
MSTLPFDPWEPNSATFGAWRVDHGDTRVETVNAPRVDGIPFLLLRIRNKAPQMTKTQQSKLPHLFARKPWTETTTRRVTRRTRNEKSIARNDVIETMMRRNGRKRSDDNGLPLPMNDATAGNTNGGDERIATAIATLEDPHPLCTSSSSGLCDLLIAIESISCTTYWLAGMKVFTTSTI